MCATAATPAQCGDWGSWQAWLLKSLKPQQGFAPGPSSAGSGMAGMTAAIPISNLVRRRHTNPMKFGQLVPLGKSLKLSPPDVRL